MTYQRFSDLSHHNIGEAIYKNGKYMREIIHPFDWSKHQAMGVTGTIMKAIQGNYLDPGYKELASTCPLQYHTAYGYLDYTRLHYTIGQEVQWGTKQGQLLCETTAKYNHTLKLAIDYEINAYWESLNNMPDTNYSFRRANTICLAMITEIHRLMGYLPILYSNLDVTRNLNKNFWDCPLWISDPGSKEPEPEKDFVGFKDWDIWQYTWTADGKKYGNFTGNKTVDLNKIKNLQNILVKPGEIITPPPPIIIETKTIEDRVTLLESEAKVHGWAIN
ncbi:MAG: GH25 family lysozyme [Bacteroidales bacterium]|jgi:GH25 family lysozyme M1 (1,4-beta-N-acetylmuramidase)